MALQHPNMTVGHRQLTAKERQMLEKPVLVHVGIVLPDGTPHVSAMGRIWTVRISFSTQRRDGPRPTPFASAAPSRSVSSILKTPTATSACVAAWSRSLVRSRVPARGTTVARQEVSRSERYPYRAPGDDGCSSGCGPRSSADGAKTSLSGFPRQFPALGDIFGENFGDTMLIFLTEDIGSTRNFADAESPER